MKPAGYNPPSDSSVKGLLNWMESRKHDHHPELPHAATITPRNMSADGLLVLYINMLAGFYAFRVPMSSAKLADDVYNEMRRRPLKKKELAAVWELLPDGHRLIKGATTTLTYHFLYGSIDVVENLALEEYTGADPALKRDFDEEERKLKRFGRKPVVGEAAKTDVKTNDSGVASPAPNCGDNNFDGVAEGGKNAVKE